MAAVILTLVLSLMVGGAIWLLVGAGFSLHEDKERNELLNLIVFIGASLPVVFLIVFFLIEII
jgi:ABC-type methionine transport system permease subunit